MSESTIRENVIHWLSKASNRDIGHVAEGLAAADANAAKTLFAELQFNLATPQLKSK